MQDASSTPQQEPTVLRRIDLMRVGKDTERAPWPAIHHSAIQGAAQLQQQCFAPSAFRPAVQLQAWAPPFQVCVDWRAALPVEFDCSMTAYAVDSATVAQLQSWRPEEGDGEQHLLNHTQQEHVVLLQAPEAHTGGSSADDAPCHARTVFTFTDLQFKEPSLVQLRWLVFAVHIPGGALAFLHFKLPTVVLNHEHTTCDQERAGALLSDASQAAAEHLAGFQRQVLKVLQGAGLHRTPSDADLRYLAAQAGYVLCPDGSCTSVATADELTLFFKWLQRHVSMLKHCRAAYNSTDPQLICGFGITRQDAEVALTQQPEGTFVLRLGRQGGMLVLSMRRASNDERAGGTIVHISIMRKDLQSLGLEAVVAACEDAEVLLDVEQGTCYQREAVLGADHQPLQVALSHGRKRVRAPQEEPDAPRMQQLTAQEESSGVSSLGTPGLTGSHNPSASTASTSSSAAPTSASPPPGWAAARWQQQQLVAEWQNRRFRTSAAAALALAALRIVSQRGTVPSSPPVPAEEGGSLQLPPTGQLSSWPQAGSSQLLSGLASGQLMPLTEDLGRRLHFCSSQALAGAAAGQHLPPAQQLSSQPFRGTLQLPPAIGVQQQHPTLQPSQHNWQQGLCQQLDPKEQQQEVQWAPQIATAAAAAQVPTGRQAYPGILLDFGTNTHRSHHVAPHHSMPPPSSMALAGQGGLSGQFVAADSGRAALSHKLPHVWPHLPLRQQGSSPLQSKLGACNGMEATPGTNQLEPAPALAGTLSSRPRDEEMISRVASLEDALPRWEELTEGLSLNEDPSSLIIKDEQGRRWRRRH